MPPHLQAFCTHVTCLMLISCSQCSICTAPYTSSLGWSITENGSVCTQLRVGALHHSCTLWLNRRLLLLLFTLSPAMITQLSIIPLGLLSNLEVAPEPPLPSLALDPQVCQTSCHAKPISRMHLSRSMKRSLHEKERYGEGQALLLRVHTT
jgi:hypothetical protein